METVSDFIFWGSKILQMVTTAMKLKDTYSLEGKTNLDSILKSRDITLPTNLENSAVAIGLEKFSFHSNPKEMQCQTKF